MKAKQNIEAFYLLLTGLCDWSARLEDFTTQVRAVKLNGIPRYAEIIDKINESGTENFFTDSPKTHNVSLLTLANV